MQPGKACCGEEPIVGGGTQGACIQGTHQLFIAAIWNREMNLLISHGPSQVLSKAGPTECPKLPLLCPPVADPALP